MIASEQVFAPVRPLCPRGADLADLIPGAPALLITGVSMSSLAVCQGDLYVGIPGATTHGARFAAAAVAAGAVAVATDQDGIGLVGDLGVPVNCVQAPRQLIGAWAAEVYGHPASRMQMFGITGTNGKTTSMYLLASALTAAGRTVATIGTIGACVAGETIPMNRSTVTTPESTDLQALLAVMLERGADTVVMEVSSHALAMHRVDSVTFDVAGFTNLGWDHRDFHPTQEHYYEAKSRLFLPSQSRSAVIAIDGVWGQRLAEQTRATGMPVLTTGKDAQVRATSIQGLGGGAQRVDIDLLGHLEDVVLSIPGSHNVSNLVTAVAMLHQAGVDLENAIPGFAKVSIPGRLERIELAGDAPDVYVDFAHTPEAVEAALSALNGNRLICVLGCGGDRDHLKRGPMGAIAVNGSDLLVVTDDNPRTEEPATIREVILAGARNARQEATPDSRAAHCEVVDGGERRTAIRIALEKAKPGDVVAVLGKGHEHGQEMGGIVTAFNDGEVIREEWARLREGARKWS